MNSVFIDEVKSRLSLINARLDAEVKLLQRESFLTEKDYILLKSTALTYVESLVISSTQELDVDLKETLIIQLVEDYEKNVSDELFDLLTLRLEEESKALLNRHFNSFYKASGLDKVNIIKRSFVSNNIKNKLYKAREESISGFKKYKSTSTGKPIEIKVKFLKNTLNGLDKKLTQITGYTSNVEEKISRIFGCLDQCDNLVADVLMTIENSYSSDTYLSTEGETLQAKLKKIQGIYVNCQNSNKILKEYLRSLYNIL
jgi:hypothetical protein